MKSHLNEMKIERINGENRDAWIDDIVALGNSFLASIGACSTRDLSDDLRVVDAMIAAEQTEIFLAIAHCGKAVGIAYFNTGTGYSCGGKYIWINGVFVLETHRRDGHGSALLSAIESFGQAIGSKLIMSTRVIENLDSDGLFTSRNYIQKEQIAMTKSAPPFREST